MALVIGHSQVKYFANYLQDDRIVNLCFSGCLIRDLLIDSVKNLIPDVSVVVIVIGANDMTINDSNTIVEELQTLCETIHSLNSSATVIVSDILPCGDRLLPGQGMEGHQVNAMDWYNQKAAEINDRLAECAKYLPWLKCVSYHSFVDIHGHVDRSLLSRDGQHLSFKGIELLARVIKQCILDLLNAQQQTTNVTSKTQPQPSIQQTTLNKKNNTMELKRKMSVKKNVMKQQISKDDVEDLVKWINGDLKQRPLLVGGGENDENEPATKENQRIVTSLSHHQGLDIILNIDDTDVVNSIPIRPSGGSHFIFSSGKETTKRDDWKADGYRWRNNGNKKKTIVIEECEYIVTKKFLKLSDGNTQDDRFQKHVFTVQSNNLVTDFVLICYYGDESVYKPAPHGNGKKNSVYCPTKKSVFEAIKEEGDIKPVQVQNKVNSELNVCAKESGISDVRDSRQVKNIQASMRNKKKLSHDALFNLHELFFHLDGYISEVKLAPDVHVILGLGDAITEFDKLLTLKSDDSVCLFYDTTFNLGEFYVSTLSYQHYMFSENPVIPIAHIIHERKYQKIHEAFFQYVKDKIPRLSKQNIPIVTDREQGLINSINNIFPNLTNLICWNHIIRDVKDWLRKKGELNENITAYARQIKNLLQSNTEMDYNELLRSDTGYRNMWSELFVDYFDKTLDETIRKSAVRYVVEEFNLYNPFSGITNNAAEASNARIKRLLDFRERDIDNIVLYMFYFQNIDVNNILKSFCNVGQFHLKNKYMYACMDPEDTEINSVVHPDALIDLIKGKLELEKKQTVFDSENIKQSESSQELHFDINKDENESRSRSKTLSQESLANKVLLDKGISLVPVIVTRLA